MVKVKELQRHWNKHPEYRTAYQSLDDEFRLVRVLIEARARAGLSQAQLAARMKTSQSYIARIEGGQVRPSTAVLERLAKATGTRLHISFEPADRPIRADVLARLRAEPARTSKRGAAEVIRTERNAR